MIRPSTMLWAASVVLVGYAMFEVKYEVAQQEEELGRINRQIAAGREAIRVLNAEWSLLTQPARLNELAKRYLTLVPIGRAQLGSLNDLPLRAPSEPPAPTAPEAGQAPSGRPSAPHTTEPANVKVSVAP